MSGGGMQVDPDFTRLRASSRARQRRRGLVRWGPLAVLGLAALGGGAGWFVTHRPVQPPIAEADDIQMVQVEGQFDIAPIVHADTFGNIPGDPLILPVAETDAQIGGKALPGPQDLPADRVGPPGPERIELVSEALYARDRRLMTALPTTRQDFALFQSQRARSSRPDALAPVAAPKPIDPLADPSADPLNTQGDTGSATLYLRDSVQRQPAWEDLALAVDAPTPLAALLESHGWLPETAERTAAQAGAALPALTQALPPGSILALRWRPEAGTRRIMQLSVYGPQGYVGTLAAQQDQGARLTPGTDPWLTTDLRALAGDGAGNGGAQFRLLDAIYSAALRKGVPTETVAETIAMMSRVYDLDAAASNGDRLTLVLARTPPQGKASAGAVLYAGIDGPSGSKACFVVPDDAGGFRCFAPGARLANIAMPQMLAPVDGVMATRFGDGGGVGVAWAAADGAAVLAPASGRITALSQDADGWALTMDLGRDWTLRLTGLGAPAKGLAPDAPVVSGAPLGVMVQPAQGKAQPQLSLTLMLRGTPVDPMPALTGGQVVLGSDAVESLIERIIHVESGGNARAKNPLSTASGLGQFIESTWLRMMRSYRPDLVASLSRSQLLDLRFDPALSAEMVRHLAQENEAYLRARGHSITAGRLYLAHFLGPEGANVALSAPPDRSVAAAMGAGVVRANPFLTNYTTADLIAWAERKMSGKAPAPLPAVASEPPPPPAVQAYVEAMTRFLRSEGAADSAGTGASAGARNSAPG